MGDRDVEQLGINVIRGLAMDAPHRANSGHSGTAMALAPLAHVLFTRILRHDPTAPDWPDRDRFILSAGHASILLYSMLYLTGYDVTLDDLEDFRQWESRTPGHPEVHHTVGVEVTTGPLGQGFANGVGMAVAERYLRARFGPDVCDHRIFAICSDGDLMEGVSHEAASLAGHLGLGRLVYVYDDNRITIDGSTDLALSDDAVKRFEAYGWHVEDIGESANDTEVLEGALRRAMEVEDRPSLVVLRSHIGWPAPEMTDTAEAHGNPFSAEEINKTKEILGLPPDRSFYVPDEVLALYRECVPRGQRLRKEQEERLAAWSGDRAELQACLAGRGLAGWEQKLPTFEAGEKIATRKASQKCLNAVLDLVPALVVGGADLTGNTGTNIDSPQHTAAEPDGRKLFYGVREHAMGATMTGMALHGGVVPVGGTFFVFSDYMRPAVRLAAISEAHVVYSWTHDSVGLGEDGPTHQPIEHLPSLRAMPGLRLIRPADANETAHAWRVAIDRDGPTGLLLTRQDIPVLDGTAERAADVARGAYVLRPGGDDPHLILAGSGSEVAVCLAAADVLAEEGVVARVVSMPSWELFDEQDEAYQEAVLPEETPILAVEAASPFGWERYADEVVGIDRFGASAPGATALENLGINPEAVAAAARLLLDDLEEDET